MHKSSFLAPKRCSARPAKSREDARIDRRSSLLEDAVKFTPVPCARRGEANQYRLKLASDNDNIVGLSALEDELRTAGLNLRASAVENILNTLCEIVPEYIVRTGRAVRLGDLVTLKPYATGTIANANDAPDPDKNHLEIRATVGPSLRYALANARLVNSTRQVDGIDLVVGGPDGKNGEVDDGNEISVYGHHIYLPLQSAGDTSAKGRAWLETRKGDWLGDCDVVMSGVDHIDLRLHLGKTPPTRDCRLVVETYGTPAAAEHPSSPLYSYRRNVRLAPLRRLPLTP